MRGRSWTRVRVVGPSMVPTLRDGDLLLVRLGAPARPGDVVLAVFRDRPDRYVVKRAVYPTDGGWWLSSDNTFVDGDSTTHGVADVRGRVLFRRRRRSIALQRIRRVDPRG